MLVALQVGQGKYQWWIQEKALKMHAPFSVQFLSFSCSFQQNQISGWHPISGVDTPLWQILDQPLKMVKNGLWRPPLGFQVYWLLLSSSFKKIWGHKSILGPLIPLVWTSGDICSGFQSKGGFAHLPASSPVHNEFFRFTSGVTSADLLVASMTAEVFHLHTWVQALVRLESIIKHAADSPYVKRQILYQLSYPGSAFLLPSFWICHWLINTKAAFHCTALCVW